MQIKKLLEEQEKEFVNKYNSSVLLAYPEYAESHMILLTDIWNWHKQSLKQFIDGLMESLEGKREEDLSDKDIEDRLRVFTLTPFSEESIKEFVKVIGGISAKMGKNKAINDQISHLKEIGKQLE